LKPGGRLGLLEPGAVKPADTREQLARRHQFSLALAEADLAEAGFEVVRRDPDFARMPPHNHGAEGNVESPVYFLLIAKRP
jgi:hypothetical protein